MNVAIRLPLFVCIALCQLCAGGLNAQDDVDAIDIDSRRELFVDESLIDALNGVQLQLRRPKPQEVVLVTDSPWEGNTSAYYTIFQDADKYRMYYRGSHFDEQTKQASHREVVCYAESMDGVHWEKPNLGLFEFDGSKANNIVWDGIGSHNFTPFKDSNPNCKQGAEYKALARGRSLRSGDKSSAHGLFAFQSGDGIHWELMQDQPVITEGAFDSQNLAFYDNLNHVYRDYHRWFNNGVRDIMSCTSTDFLNWTNPVGLRFDSKKSEHLYTNAIRPYPRAPHIFIGFPTRYLPGEGQRVEPVFMSSRDGLAFRRWPAAVIPEDAPRDRSGNRSNYMAWGLVQLPDNSDEYSMYATEAYYTGPDSRLRRFSIRVDGFVAAHAPSVGGTLQTKPLIFSGDQLELNAAVAKDGYVRVEIQDSGGTPLDRFSLRECVKIQVDAVSIPVHWNSKASLASLSGREVRVVFELMNADLYSFRFHGQE